MIKIRPFINCILSPLCLFLLLLALILAQPITVKGQQLSLSISPPLLEVFIKPGKSIMVAYQLENYGDPTILSTKVLPFEPKNNLGQIKIKEEFEGPIRFSLDNADIQLGQPFFLKTRQSQQILLRIRVPEGAPEGDYYYTLLAETQFNPTESGATQSVAKGTIGSNILITVTGSGKVDIKGKISLFEVLPRWSINLFGQKIKIFDSNDKIPVVLVVENKGKNLIKPQGEIILKGNFGEKANFEILSQNILAESQRLLSATPSAKIDCQENEKEKACLSPVSLIISGFFVGFYKLSTSVIFGENSPYVFASTSFVALPFKILLGFFIATIIGIIIIKKISKNDDK